MADTQVPDMDAIGAGCAEPYTPEMLADLRPIIERFNRPSSTQRRLLATIDTLLAAEDWDELRRWSPRG